MGALSRGLSALLDQPVRRKVFVSYFRADRLEVEAFVHHWTATNSVFIPQIVGAYGRDLINSDNAEYVIGRVRREYIADSTVTMVLVGSCTHSRRHVDWEIKASLRQGESSLPNGLLGIVLPSRGPGALLPPRLEANWVPGNLGGYARYYVAPTTAYELRAWIDDAFQARSSRASLIRNPTKVMEYNSRCQNCDLTHSLRDDMANPALAFSQFLWRDANKMRCFMVTYNPFAVNRDTLTTFLDSRPEISNWYSLLPGSIVVVSRGAAPDVAKLLREHLPHQFLTVVGISESDGWMPGPFWEFVNSPKSSGRWDSPSSPWQK